MTATPGVMATGTCTIFLVTEPAVYQPQGTPVMYSANAPSGQSFFIYGTTGGNAYTANSLSLNDVGIAPGHVRIDAYVLTSTSGTMYQGGMLYSQVATGGAAISGTTLTLGTYGPAPSDWSVVLVGEHMVFNRALAAAEIAQVSAYLDAKWDPPGSGLSFYDGDSELAGYHGSGPIQVTGTNAYDPWEVKSVAIVGKFISTSLADFPYVAPFLDQKVPNKIAHLWEGTNDISVLGTSGTTAYNELVALSGSYHSIGFKTVAITMLPDGSGTEAQRQIFDNLIVNAPPGTFDAVIDVRNYPTIGAAGANTNTTYYYSDALHLNSAGYAPINAAVAYWDHALRNTKPTPSEFVLSTTLVNGTATVNDARLANVSHCTVQPTGTAVEVYAPVPYISGTTVVITSGTSDNHTVDIHCQTGL